MSDLKIQVWTDGACRGNGTTGSIGGYGIVLKSNKGSYKELKCAERNTTNNIQEMKAAIAGLKALKIKDCEVILYSDSDYVVKGLMSWYKSWRRNGWKTSNGKDVKNPEIWRELIALWESFPSITAIHVDGHAGIELNERCDKLATQAIDELLSQELYEE